MNKDMALGVAGLFATGLVIAASVWSAKEPVISEPSSGRVPDIISMVTGRHGDTAANKHGYEGHGFASCMTNFLAMMCQPMSALQQGKHSWFGNQPMVCPTGLRHEG